MTNPRAVVVWLIAVFSAAVLSSLIGVVGWILNQSDLPPYGGGVLNLIVLPMAVVWIVILGIAYVGQKHRAPERSHSEAL